MDCVTAKQGFVFDEVADLYDRARPGYPDALIDDAIVLAGVGPAGRVLEIGSGTGKATDAFVRRGLRVVCIEPGPSLARVARQQFAGAGTVTIVEHTFESWPLEPEAFDLVVAAQAFHWLSPETRFTKAAATLRPGGSLAVFGNSPVMESSPLRVELDRVYSQLAPAIRKSLLTRWYADEISMRALFAASGHFGAVTMRVYPWRRTYDVEPYLDLLRTQSDHRLLSDEDREVLLDGVRAAIMRHGGTITVRYEAHLYLAGRRP
jgi:SAM-dependent methyltransferase